MSRKHKVSTRIPTGASSDFGSNPFASLDGQGLPEALPEPQSEIKVSVKQEESNLGKGVRLEIRREKSGRGGKTVTTVRGIPPTFGKEKKNKLLKRMKSSLGTGGTWAGQDMELQGDRRAEALEWLRAMGFRPVLAGG